MKDQMTELPTLPAPRATRPWPHSGMQLLIAAGLLVASGLPGYALFQYLAPTPAVRPPPLRVATVLDAELLPDDPAWWWPETLGAAAGMFQCQPSVAARSSGTRPTETGARTVTPTGMPPVASMIVWADKGNRVMAFGATAGSAPLPAYADALRPAKEALPAHQPLHVAGPGHILRMTPTKITLRLQAIELACVRTWDD